MLLSIRGVYFVPKLYNCPKAYCVSTMPWWLFPSNCTEPKYVHKHCFNTFYVETADWRVVIQNISFHKLNYVNSMLVCCMFKSCIKNIGNIQKISNNNGSINMSHLSLIDPIKIEETLLFPEVFSSFTIQATQPVK